jgi:hypothetical protein
MATDNPWPRGLESAAELLARAAAFTESLQCSPWDFAVEISELRATGLTQADLRYLVCLGLLEHAKEIPADAMGKRRFQGIGQLTFVRRTCFILSPAGRLALSGVIAASEPGKWPGERRSPSGNHSPKRINGRAAAKHGLKPDWDPALCRLMFGGLVVKQYRATALNQHIILAAFQEEQWPLRIDDPLPPVNRIDPKRRLHDTIAGLNRNQLNSVVHFHGDGSGRGVRWVAIVRESISSDGCS